MKRYSFILIILIFATSFAMSQDIIVKKDGSIINVYNLDEGKDVYYYTLQPSADAPLQKIKKSEIFTTRTSVSEESKHKETHKTNRTSAHQHQPVTATFTREIEPIKTKKGVQQGRKFVAQTPDGHELNYQVLSEDNHTLQVINGSYKENSYIIPEYVIVDDIIYTVTEIGEKVFHNCGKINEIQLPSTLIKIGVMAFSRTNFKDIVFPEGLQIIDKKAFHIASLERIILPESLVELGKWSFISCSQSKTFYELYIPSSIKRIGEDSFRYIGEFMSPRGFYKGYISSMPDFITEQNCSFFGIDDDAVRIFNNTK